MVGRLFYIFQFMDKQYNDFIGQVAIELSESMTDEQLLNSEFELITTAKQTDPRYGDFRFSKKQLEEMATNFNQNVVGTEIPVDLNHHKDHVALAWIKPGSMRVGESKVLS